MESEKVAVIFNVPSSNRTKVSGSSKVRLTEGNFVSITMALLLLNEFAAPAVGKVVMSRSFPATSRIVPKSNVNALEVIYPKSLDVCPDATTYVKTRFALPVPEE